MSCAMEREIPSIHETLEDCPLIAKPSAILIIRFTPLKSAQSLDVSDVYSVLTWGCEF